MGIELYARGRAGAHRYPRPDRTGISPDPSCRGHVCCGPTAHAASVCRPRSRWRRHRGCSGGPVTSAINSADMKAVAMELARERLSKRQEPAWVPDEELAAISVSRWEPVNLNPV